MAASARWALVGNCSVASMMVRLGWWCQASAMRASISAAVSGSSVRNRFEWPYPGPDPGSADG